MFRLAPEHLDPRVRPLRRASASRPSWCSRRSASASRRSGHSNPWLLPLALAPLVLIHRSLAVPALQLQARIDPKTASSTRATSRPRSRTSSRARQRFDRPLSLLMCDLDLLRDINNDYGHLAGDAVLRGVADVFRQELRHYDIPARFGGEEFSILLPETASEQALEIADRIRRSLAARRFRGRDVERADPRDDLDRRRGVSDRRQPAPNELDPPGRPGGLPREAPGPEPRRRRPAPSRACSTKPDPQPLASVPGIEVQPRAPRRASMRRSMPVGGAGGGRTPPAADAAESAAHPRSARASSTRSSASIGVGRGRRGRHPRGSNDLLGLVVDRSRSSAAARRSPSSSTRAARSR